MKKTFKILVAAVTALGLAGFSAPVFADDKPASDANQTTTVSPDAPPILIQVSPVSTQAILEPGKTKEYAMTIRNSGSTDFSYHLYTTPYTVADENYNIDFSKETRRTQISRWIKFYQDDKLVDRPTFKIKPGEVQTIKYVIQVPEDIPAGGQYATIFAETDTNNEAATSSGIRTASRVGMIVYGRTSGDTVEDGEVTDFSIPGFLVSGNISATSKVKNSGNTDFEAEYTFKVSSILGAELYSKNTTYNVLPDTDIERRVNLEWADTPFMGIFKVYYKVTTPGDHGSREEEKIVIKFPIVMIILTILVLTGLTIGIIMTVRKRKERKARLAV